MGSEVTSDLLDDIFASVDAAEAGFDGAANSCDEEDDESDLDVPKALSPPPQSARTAPKPSYAREPRQPSYPAASGVGPTPSSSSSRRGPLTPAPPNRVSAEVGRGGRMVYQVFKPVGDVHYYMVQWRKPQQKKHKTWDGDAFLKVEGSRVTMVSEEGKHMATAALVGGLPGPGTELRIGQFDCEVDRGVDFDDCLNNATNTPLQSPANPLARVTGGSTPKPFRPPASRLLATPVNRPFSPVMPSATSRASSDAGPSTSTPTSGSRSVAASSFYSKPSARPARKIVIGEKNSKEREAWGGAIHDPDRTGALVMPRPPEAEAKRKGTAINDVVVDPILADKMRDHQREGVTFMYRCVMGMTAANGNGCILADEMGLGKTLQTISLIYTLLKQSPWQNESSVISRALVVCPVSLVNNWRQEFRKWLPRDFGIAAIEDKEDAKISAFTHHRGLQVMIIGYEKLRKIITRLKSCQPPIGLIVCDEAHRLKSKDNKTTKMFDELNCTRRIMLTGTPVQNDLGEYWAMADFACPGVFGPYSSFARQYERPILKSRTKCSRRDAEAGQMKLDELKELGQEFVLRRTSEVLKDFLPPKTEYVVFVAPSKLQLDVYAKLLGGGKNLNALIEGMAFPQRLAMIDLLRKVANSPTLLRKREAGSYDGDASLDAVQSALDLIPQATRTIDVSISGKLRVLERILAAVRTAPDEKIVVVSNWTTTLNIVQDLCIKNRYDFLRLDGSTPQKQRQDLVDKFNRGSRMESMVFLLSAKAGGVGLNLIGASRLVLFDSDWNPSTDLQAMARIHRDGQKKPVHIYRLLTANTIDEKIYQRQITKMGLSDQMLGDGGNGKTSKDSFSNAELRDLFTISHYTNGCGTHDLLGCPCEGKGVAPEEGGSAENAVDLLSSETGEDEDANAGFISASQYDPEPTPGMVRKEAREQQQKLASLKEWLHIDPFDVGAVGGVKDDLLYALLKDAYESGDAIPASKKRKSDEGTSVSGASTPIEILDSEEDDDEPVLVGHRRKRGAGRTSVLANLDQEKKHNLRDIAARNQAGRIMFVFEKESKPRL